MHVSAEGQQAAHESHLRGALPREWREQDRYPSRAEPPRLPHARAHPRPRLGRPRDPRDERSGTRDPSTSTAASSSIRPSSRRSRASRRCSKGRTARRGQPRPRRARPAPAGCLDLHWSGALPRRRFSAPRAGRGEGGSPARASPRRLARPAVDRRPYPLDDRGATASPSPRPGRVRAGVGRRKRDPRRRVARLAADALARASARRRQRRRALRRRRQLHGAARALAASSLPSNPRARLRSGAREPRRAWAPAEDHLRRCGHVRRFRKGTHLVVLDPAPPRGPRGCCLRSPRPGRSTSSTSVRHPDARARPRARSSRSRPRAVRPSIVPAVRPTSETVVTRATAPEEGPRVRTLVTRGSSWKPTAPRSASTATTAPLRRRREPPAGTAARSRRTVRARSPGPSRQGGAIVFCKEFELAAHA